MQHSQIVEDHLIERYLLDEMAGPARDEFEEHFFECRECATELKSTAAFLDATREELRNAALQRGGLQRAGLERASAVERPESGVKAWWMGLWTPAFGLSVAAACLLLVAYQNVVVLPKLHTEVARLESPEVVPTLSLIGAASRGGEIPSAAVPRGGSLVLQVDIPAEARFVTYTCRIYSPSQRLVGSVEVSPQQARDTVDVRFRVPEGEPGHYSLVVHGNEAAASGSSGVDLARDTFQIN